MPTSPEFPAWWHATKVINQRSAPNEDPKCVEGVQPAGHNLLAVEKVFGDGRWWLKSSHGNFYARQYCAPNKASTRIGSPVPGYRMSTRWGKKPPIVNGREAYWTTRHHHTGVDFAAPQGANAVVIRNGTVVRIWDSVLGNVALLYCTDKRGRRVTFWYCHLLRIVKTGRVKAGDHIGEVGQTGTGAHGPHLHLEVRYGHQASWMGRDYNPLDFW